MITGPLLGASAVIVRDGRVLLGLRQGAHGAGTWGLPGGKVDPGEHPRDTVIRELSEEAGLVATSVRPLPWTNDLFPDEGPSREGLHYVTLHHFVTADGEPRIVEPDKLVEWRWVPWDALPEPLFPSFAALVRTGWHPDEVVHETGN